ncbi:MAG: holin family protein [Alphaproteobacteria bacterium]|nr:holin family protein [Alphaproteobacteria bacterium]
MIGMRQQAESNTHDEQIGAMNAFSREFTWRGERYWFDSFVDGLNRLPRPLLAFGVIWLLWFAVQEPIEFSVIMQALALVPEWLALIIGQIVLLFFGGRMLERWPRRMTAPSAREVKEVVAGMEELRSLDKSADRAPFVPATMEPIRDDNMPSRAYDAEMADRTKPMSNAAIMEWNRRRHLDEGTP